MHTPFAAASRALEPVEDVMEEHEGSAEEEVTPVTIVSSREEEGHLWLMTFADALQIPLEEVRHPPFFLLLKDHPSY